MTLLLLAGTAEAREICHKGKDLPILASLAGVTRAPRDLGIETRIGGFGGEVGFAAFLNEREITAVIDATHPFAGMVPRTADICAERVLPYLRVLRPAWQAGPGMRWQHVPSLSAACDALPDEGVVFLATGSGSLPVFAQVKRPTIWLRRADPSAEPAPWPLGGFLEGLPSDTPEEELKLFEKHNITHLIAKNSGGTRGYAKLIAAQKLALSVIMVDRPKPPEGVEIVATADQALEWMQAHV